jgi:predicted membrane protein
MADKEKKNLEKGEGDLEEQDCPLSPTAWIMFLSGEIYNEENTNNQDSPIPTVSLLAAITLSIISLILVVGTTNFPDNTINTIRSALSFSLFIFIILIFVYVGVLLYIFLYRLSHLFPKTQKRVEALKKLRREIIFGKNDSNNIREEWEEIYRTSYPKKRSNGLEKSEIDDKSEMMRTHSANFWYALGGSCIAIGGVVFFLGV